MNKMGTGINKKVIFLVMIGVLLLGIIALAIPVYAPSEDKQEKLVYKELKKIAKKLGKLVDKFELVLTSIDGTPESIMDEIESVRDKACSIVDQAKEVLGDGITCSTPPRRG